MISAEYVPMLKGVGDTRPLALIEVMERILPQDRLDYTVSPDGNPIPVQSREALLRTEALKGEIPLVCNGNEDRLVSVSGHSIPPILAPGSVPILDVIITLPEIPDYYSRADEILQRTCELMDAYWGVESPDETAATIGAQTFFPWAPSEPPLGLPPLRPPQQLSSPALPYHFGWLNYWSSEAARIIGFFSNLRDLEWFAGYRKGSNGGWLLKLTESPLDLRKPEHLLKLKEAYARFPKIGRG